jgi:hypothetical protein
VGPRQPPAGAGATRERWESLAALHRLAGDLAVAVPTAGLRELVVELEERAAAQHAPSVEGVTLASLHAAKGLEWDAVFLVGLVDGTMPLVHADTPDAVEEERRLLYVGVTRARFHLSLSWALSRSPGGRGSRRPSRFLDGLHKASARPAPAPGPPGRPARALRPGDLPRLRRLARGRRRPQARPLRGLPVDDGRAAVRGAARVAGRPGQGAEPAGVLRVHRRDADRPSPSSGRRRRRAGRDPRDRQAKLDKSRRRRAQLLVAPSRNSSS